MREQFSGELETHITVDEGDASSRVDHLARWALERGLRLLHIVLARGRTPSQPMLTRRRRGTLVDELRAAERLAAELEASGFDVKRIKIEASADGDDVPISDDDARACTERYFEHHVKLLLAPGVDLTVLATIAEAHGAHLSRSALRAQGDGLDERYVTQRCPGAGRDSARRRLGALVLALAPHHVVGVDEEFVVHDTNRDIDAGWLPDGS